MTLLASHLEQISASAKAIAELEFPPPKRFTNALLSNAEITTLIRDTEPYERALFSLDHNAVTRSRQRSNNPDAGPNGRKSGFNPPHPLKPSAVTLVLGTDMLREIRQSSNARAHGGVNVEVLLRGAEKLCEVYNVAGASDKIRALRNRHKEVAASIAVLEKKVLRQQSLLERRPSTSDPDNAGDENDRQHDFTDNDKHAVLTEDDFQLEEDEIQELEVMKKRLEDRVSGMERDLGGLLK
ncbi:hypothetical protein G647_04396 [Cladophialophora carrionii CBS 160.54]|uniref:DASH complex subunit SPC34 n=1 Tax=Cladophialophora carrionii CBS 160.54 TaxID=1279043 RepID=V9DEC7_9EURO|nr:uncharacterized protein G647_04396 [Cladophialophora carrionii CBS 160.54]ETI25026.1 hypothetical protein G647_04396 [Cladophialophora carrionii CBS 160.54]